MRKNTKNGNQRFIPHSDVFHWFPLYFFSPKIAPPLSQKFTAGIRRPISGTTYCPLPLFADPASPPHHRHLHFFHGSFSQFPFRSPFPIPRRHCGFISLIAPHRFRPSGTPPVYPPKDFPENSQPFSPPFSLPPYTYASNKKKEKGLLSFKSSPFRRSP